MSSAAPPSRKDESRPSLRDRIPLLAMLTADGLGLLGQGFAIGLLGAVLAAGDTDAVIAAAVAAPIAGAALAWRARLSGPLTRTGLWRSSVAADGLAAVGVFAVVLHQNARADHPLVLAFGVAAAAVGIVAQLLLGPRVPPDLVRQARVAPESIVRRWTRKRGPLRGVSVGVGAVAVVLIGPQAGWLAFACFVQGAEAVVVLVPFGHRSGAAPLTT